MTPKLTLISPSPVERRSVGDLAADRQAHARHVAEAQLNVLALGAEFVEQLRELSALRGDNVCVDHEAPLLADYNERVIGRMVASVRNGGRVR